MTRTPHTNNGALLKRRVQWLFAAFVLANLAVVAAVFLKRQPPSDPELTTPVLALRTLGGQAVFRFERGPDFAQAAQNPRLFRQLDRIHRFDALLLTGDPTLCRPLIEHLLASPDWTLVYLDHLSLGFRRAPATAWTLDDLQTLSARFDASRPARRVRFLSGAAVRLLAIHRSGPAKEFIEEALRLDPRSPDALQALALHAMQFSKWSDALDAVERALQTRKNHPPLLALEAQALLALGRVQQAFAISRKLLEAAPDDPQTLFLHARIAHQARAFDSEVRALRHLIDLAEKAKQSASGYRIYLGQALAQRGDGRAAIEQFEQALVAGDLSEDQAKFARETIAHLKGQ